MRILTRTQYEAICDIVTDLQKENEELKAKLDKKNETIDYLNDKVFAANERYATLLRSMSVTQVNVDFPAVRPENKLF